MNLKAVFVQLLDKFLKSNLRFIYWVLDNQKCRAFFLKKYLRNRPDLFSAYYTWKPARKSKKILILKTDAIGDYLLFRNCIEEISEKYRPLGYQIFLAGNQLWNELAIELDEKFLDGFFWLDRSGFNSKPKIENRIEFLQNINEYSFEFLLYPNYSREWEAGDWLVAHITAKNKVAFKGNLSNEKLEEHETGNLFYSQLVHPASNVKFDFFRNIEITEAFLGQKLAITKPTIQGIEPEKPVSGHYVVLFPGASNESKRWPIERFAEVVNWLVLNTDLSIILAGSNVEAQICNSILSTSPTRCQSLAGKTSILGLLRLIAGSSLVISNDTAALHMGIQCGIPSIALWKGNHYGRFLPYPEKHFSNFFLCLPDSIEKLSETERQSAYAENYGLDISEVPSEKVLIILETLFSNQKIKIMN